MEQSFTGKKGTAKNSKFTFYSIPIFFFEANFFSEYGPVFDAMVKYDPNTRISRCFGFVTFLDSDDIVQSLCKERFFSVIFCFIQ